MKTKSRSSYDQTLLPRLRAAGWSSASPARPEWLHDLVIQVSKPELTVAYDGRAGTEYVFSVRVTNHSYSSLMVQEFRARFPWRAYLYWPGDPRIYTPEREVYRLESGRNFPCDEVLNHRLGERGVLNSGESMEGLLLAYTMFDRILPDCMHGTTAPVRLFAKDQFGRKHRSEIEISIDRSATMRQMFLRSRGTGLYGDDGGVRPVVFSQPKPEPPNSIGERGSRMDKEKTQ